jgi:hypothetical protein
MRRFAPFAPLSAALLVVAASLAHPAVSVAQGAPPCAPPSGGKTGPSSYLLTLGLGGGTVIPTGSSGVPHGSNIQGYALVQLPGFLTLRFNIGYQKFNLNNAVQGAPDYNGSTQEVLNGVGGIQIKLLPGPVQPYLVAGLGAYKYTVNSDTTAGAPNTSSLNFGINAGGGLAVHFGRFSGFAEGIVTNVYTNTGGYIKSAKNIAYVPVTFGLAVGVI